MIDNVVPKYALRTNKSKIFKKIKPCKPVRIPVVKPEHNEINIKSPSPSNSIYFKGALFNRARTPKKTRVPKIKDLTDDFKKTLENTNARDSNKSCLTATQSLPSFIKSKANLNPNRSSQSIIKKLDLCQLYQVKPQPLLFLAQIKKSIRKVIQTLTPGTNIKTRIFERHYSSISPLNRHNLLKSLH